MPLTIRTNVNYQISSTATVNEGVTTSTFTYIYATAGIYTFVANPATYQIKLWGGGGGGAAGAAGVNPLTGAGAGGLATDIAIDQSEIWTIHVGQGGRSATGSGSVGNAVAGVGGTGYGQGGNAAGGGNAWGGGGGGGSSAVVTSAYGVFVAGGGGGSGSQGGTVVATEGSSGTSAGGLLGPGGSSGASGLLGGGGGGGSSLTGAGGGQGGKGGSNSGQPQSIGAIAQTGQNGAVGIATTFPGNTGDADYVAGTGVGGQGGISNGGDGRIVIRQTVIRGTYTFNISAPTVPDGTVLYWTNSGTTTADDFAELTTSGTVTITNGVGSVILNILGDARKEGSETILFQLRTESITGPIVAERTVTINDAVIIDPILNTVNSLGVTIVPGATEITEEGRIDFFVTANQIADGTTLYWDVSGNVTLLDFFQQVTTGTLVISQGGAVVRLNLFPDRFTEGTEFLIFRVRLNSTTGPVLAQSDRILITDSSIFPPTGASLYSFGAFTFTTAGLTGPNGPTRAQCLASYNTTLDPWLTNTSYFDVSPTGYQRWTVPATGPYRIIAAGAPGGPIGGGNRGAQIQGDFGLESGQIVRIVVGQYGGGANSGGGASFVVKDGGNTNANILVIAGGGGGKSFGAAGQAGQANSAGQNRGGLGGVGAVCNWNGSAGGGFLTNGSPGAGPFTTFGTGFGFATNARGGSGGIGPGGFGGGGSGGTDGIAGAGAGGGYNGGDGQCDGSSGQGGGSFNNGNNQVNTANSNALAGGFVIISKLFA